MDGRIDGYGRTCGIIKMHLIGGIFVAAEIRIPAICRPTAYAERPESTARCSKAYIYVGRPKYSLGRDVTRTQVANVYSNRGDEGVVD